ncbi:DUF6807 family protein [Jiangella rhizosphaerae]|uniref:DUF6807 family protein n=1 Tax=Jiangella rhizosphaerae TaxID=2293569 RepID=UPI001F2B0FF6|nr:DUF6807 family protein [Jiangella rhizosphaerae]
MGVSRPRVALAGVHGYGALHLRRLLAARDRVDLVAVADPVPPGAGLPPGTAVHADLASLLDATPDIDVVVVATPIHTHAALAERALLAGADLLLEKPPFARLADFHRIRELARAERRAVQVGFQSLGSHALAEFDRDAFGLGPVTAVGAVGLWRRDRSYWRRSEWAGRRRLAGVDVVDGVVTNPLAHAVVTALRIAGARGVDDIGTIDLDQYRANDIEADDTSVVRIRTAGGAVVTCALTLCAPEQRPPVVTVSGPGGDAEFDYTSDRVVTSRGTRLCGRTDLLGNLLDHREHGTALVAPLEATGAFMAVMEAVRTAPPPIAVDAARTNDGVPVPPGIVGLATVAARRHATFRELGAPWAAPRADSRLATLRIAGQHVAHLLDGMGAAPASSPRPFLDRVRTLGGVLLSTAHPADHDWHVGVSVGITDVDGANFWGGRTYRRPAGYVWQNNHGRVFTAGIEIGPGRLAQRLEWRASESVLLYESRLLSWCPVEALGWQLTFEFTLTPAAPSARLASPGASGRPGAGYGGFFWRFPACDDVLIRNRDGATGEDAVHGRRSDWLLWSGRFAGRPATVVFRARDAHGDPWFVRHRDYPAVGAALAWDRPRVVRRAAPLTRSFQLLIADGRLSSDDVEAWAASAGSRSDDEQYHEEALSR